MAMDASLGIYLDQGHCRDQQIPDLHNQSEIPVRRLTVDDVVRPWDSLVLGLHFRDPSLDRSFGRVFGVTRVESEGYPTDAEDEG